MYRARGIIDDADHILPEVLAARKRGVWFEVGNGRNGHLRWDIAERVLKAGFLPDTFSTDWSMEARTSQVINFENVVSKFLMLGMRLDQVIACATVNAARTFQVFRGHGTLKVGAPADARCSSFETVRSNSSTITRTNGPQRLFPAGTVLAGKRVAPRS